MPLSLLLSLISNRVLMSPEEGGQGGNAGGGNDNPPETFTKDQLDAAISKAVADAITKNNSERDEKEKGLKDNRDDILREKKKAEEKLQELKDKARLADGDLKGLTEEITKRVEAQFKDKLKEAKDQLENLQNSVDNNNIHSALDAQLEGLKVKSVLRRSLKNDILAENEITKSEESGLHLINGEPIESFFKAWSETEDAKHYILADGNSGGGGPGNTNTCGGKQMTVADLENYEGSSTFAAARKIKNQNK